MFKNFFAISAVFAVSQATSLMATSASTAYTAPTTEPTNEPHEAEVDEIVRLSSPITTHDEAIDRLNEVAILFDEFDQFEENLDYWEDGSEEMWEYIDNEIDYYLDMLQAGLNAIVPAY